MHKFFCYIFIIVVLFSCSNKEEASGCVLNKLPKTVDYLKQIEKIQELQKDTVVTLEKETINEKTYTTVLDIKQNEIVARIEIEASGAKKDTIEIHREDYVESFLTISTTFDIPNCKLLIKRVEMVDMESGKEKTSTKNISL